MDRKVKSLLQLANEFPSARFSKEGILILDIDSKVFIESEDLKYIGNSVMSDKVDLPEEVE